MDAKIGVYFKKQDFCQEKYAFAIILNRLHVLFHSPSRFGPIVFTFIEKYFVSL